MSILHLPSVHLLFLQDLSRSEDSWVSFPRSRDLDLACLACGAKTPHRNQGSTQPICPSRAQIPAVYRGLCFLDESPPIWEDSPPEKTLPRSVQQFSWLPLFPFSRSLEPTLKVSGSSLMGCSELKGQGPWLYLRVRFMITVVALTDEPTPKSNSQKWLLGDAFKLPTPLSIAEPSLLQLCNADGRRNCSAFTHAP